jgi:hypothetical protein
VYVRILERERVRLSEVDRGSVTMGERMAMTLRERERAVESDCIRDKERDSLCVCVCWVKRGGVIEIDLR